MDKFHIHEEVGRGRHSTVYKSRRKKTLSYVAVKSVEKSQKPRILNEVQIMFNLTHPNVLRFINWYETRNHIWLIVEFCTGGNLRQILEQDTRLPADSVRLFANDLLAGISYVFAQGIVLGDLKTSTLLVDGVGRLKISDFAMSKRVGGQEPEQTRGTPAYMAPELFSDPPSPHTFETDLWALGCILYEMSVGETPFAAPDLESIAKRIVSDTPKIPNYVPNELSHLIIGLLEKDSTKRFKLKDVRDHPFIKGKKMAFEEPKEQPKSNAAGLEDRIQAGLAVARRVLEKEKPSTDAIYQQTRTGVTTVTTPTANADTAIGVSQEITESDEEDEEIADDSDEEGRPIPKPKLPLKHLVRDRLGAASPRVVMADEPESVGLERPESAPPGSRWLRPESAKATPRLPSARKPSNRPPLVRPTSAPQGGRRPVESGTKPTLDNIMSTAVLDDAFEHCTHPSDNLVRPIAGNKHIERLQPPSFDANALPFDVPSDFEAMNGSDLESFVSGVYHALQTSKKPSDIIGFCVKVSSTPNVSNTMVNSSLMTLLVNMMRKGRSPGIKARLCHLFGMMFRHATYVGSEVDDTGVIQALVDVLRERNERVKRRGMAALGELLFYVATQQESEESDDGWKRVSPNVFKHVVRILRTGEDGVLQHYAVQTLYNITTYSQKWANEVASLDTLVSLWGVYRTAAGEWLRLTCSATIAKLCLLMPSLVPSLVDRVGTKAFLTGLSDEKSAVVQQMFVTALISGLTHDGPARFFTGLLDVHRSLSPILMAMFGHSAPALRGKALLAMASLCVRHGAWFASFCQHKLATRLDRIMRDKDEYVQKCLEVLLSALAVVVPSVLQAVASELERAVSRARPPHTVLRHIKEYLSYAPAVMDCVTSNTLRPRVVNDDMITGLGRCLVLADNDALVSADGQRTLLLISEAITQRPALLRSHTVAVLERLLPALTSLLASESGDTRFWGLKMTSDCIISLMGDTDVYSKSVRSSENAFSGTRKMNEVIVTQLLPKFNSLLADRDPVPLYTTKLLSSIFEHNPSFIIIAYRLKLIPVLFEMFDSPEYGGTPSRYDIELIRHIVSSPDIDAQYCFDLNLAKKVNNVLAHTVNSDGEWIESLLDIATAMLGMTANKVGQLRSSSKTAGGMKTALARTEELVRSVPIFVQLLLHEDASIIDTAAQLLYLSVLLYPQCIRMVSTRDNLAIIASILGSKAPAKTRVHVLEVVGQLLRTRSDMTEDSQSWEQLEAELSKTCSDPEDIVATAAQAAVLNM